MVKTLDLDGKSLAPNDDLNGINQMISDDLRVSPDFFRQSRINEPYPLSQQFNMAQSRCFVG